ncbi:hypothetical protein [Pseudopelagicola sp. nBUS_19]|uniref:hypothetical protein n=1 Tax=unclassified Pseudopelagicola TaxID=2649563 RepID=UPI003EC0EEEC
MQNEILAVVRASTPRRWLGIFVLGSLGCLLVYLGFTTSPSFAWQMFLIITGFAFLWLANATRRATEFQIELTRQEIRTSSGEIIAYIGDITQVERGVFAMKPSNGFLLRLKTSRARRWQPGLWWAMGRKVGIGGVTPASQSKAMAQILEAILAEAVQEADHAN